MLYQNIISAIGLIGIGAVIKSLIDSLLKKREVKSQTQHEFKNTRYKAIILLANAMLDFDKHKAELHRHNRFFNNKEQLLDELVVERNNMILFSSDNVILMLNRFVSDPGEDTFYTLTIAMRKDLYGLKTSLRPSSLKL
jgi:hypothetical protein